MVRSRLEELKKLRVEVARLKAKREIKELGTKREREIQRLKAEKRKLKYGKAITIGRKTGKVFKKVGDDLSRYAKKQQKRKKKSSSAWDFDIGI